MLEPKSKFINKNIIKKIKKLINITPVISLIIKKIDENNGRVLLVGGAVRDLLLGLPVKDLDLEVHGIDSKKLEIILKQFGSVNLVGKIYGVFRLSGLDIDWSLPRIDSSGRKPKVFIDPRMSIKQAFKRRDLTINAMGIDLITNELLDPFNGEADLSNKILRATNIKTFCEDPLRFYRVMQFIGRFEMQPNSTLNKICKRMDISNISRERIDEEFKKLFIKSKRPSLGFNWLRKIGRLAEILPEVYDLIDVPQSPEWHPEGDVYEHSMQALDAAARYKEDKFILCLAGLCHDLGKAKTTRLVNGKYISYGHDKVGEKLTKNLLKRILTNKDIILCASKLVRYHMQPSQFVSGNARPATYKRLAKKLSPNTNLQMLGKLFLIDRLARNPKRNGPLKNLGKNREVKQFFDKIHKLNIEIKPEVPVLLGRDLLQICSPGPELGNLLKVAYDIQIKHGIYDKVKLKKLTLEKMGYLLK